MNDTKTPPAASTKKQPHCPLCNGQPDDDDTAMRLDHTFEENGEAPIPPAPVGFFLDQPNLDGHGRFAK